MKTIKCYQSWSEERVVEEIKAWHAKGEPLFSHYMRKHYQELLAAGIRYFGSWKQAVERAGIQYNQVRRYNHWTKENIVQTIQNLSAQGVDLSFRAMMLSGYASMVYAAIRKNYFGSWKNALEAAGLPSEDIYRYRIWDNETIIDEIKQLRDRGHDLSSKNMDMTHNSLIATARRRFGSWEDALKNAGIDYTQIRKRKRWTREGIVEGLRELKSQGVPLISTEVAKRAPGLFAAACKKKFVGTWLGAVEAAEKSLVS
jgi:molybdenum-dependent DNA-binding transcriptional regulator ModE